MYLHLCKHTFILGREVPSLALQLRGAPVFSTMRTIPPVHVASAVARALALVLVANGWGIQMGTPALGAAILIFGVAACHLYGCATRSCIFNDL